MKKLFSAILIVGLLAGTMTVFAQDKVVVWLNVYARPDTPIRLENYLGVNEPIIYDGNLNNWTAACFDDSDEALQATREVLNSLIKDEKELEEVSFVWFEGQEERSGKPVIALWKPQIKYNSETIFLDLSLACYIDDVWPFEPRQIGGDFAWAFFNAVKIQLSKIKQ